MSEFAKWTGFVVDIEASGPIPGDFSMIDIGIVKIDKDLKTTFRSRIQPITGNYNRQALNSIGVTPEEMMKCTIKPVEAMSRADKFVMDNCFEGTRPMMFSDNNGFDFMFTHWYFVHFLGMDPFGYTSRNIADLYRGMNSDVKSNFKKHRITKHTHNPVDDAMGNAEALIKFVHTFGLKGLRISE